jgi:imidazolonepropionase-like amidohydrolase
MLQRVVPALLACLAVAACATGPSTTSAPSAGSATGDATQGAPLALVGATLIDGTGAAPVADAVVLIEDEWIVCAGGRDACDVPPEARVVDLTGRWLTPGLVDAHVHFSQTAWADARPDSIPVGPLYPFAVTQAHLRTMPERFFRAYLCSGVTAVFDVGGFPWTWGLREAAESDPLAPHVAASGPLISHINPAQLALPAEQEFINLSDPEAGRAAVGYLAANRSDAVKLWFIRPAPEDRATIDGRVAAVGEAADRYGLPLIVHATELREAKVAVRAGARLLVHSVADVPVDQEFIDLLKANDVIYTPTLVVRDGYLRMFDSALSGLPPSATDDPNRCVDRDTLEKIARSAEVGHLLTDRIREAESYAGYKARAEQRSQTMIANLKRLHDAGVAIAMGTDAGNPLTVHGPSVYWEMEAMQAAGMTPEAVLVSATRTGARAMGRERDFGTVVPGKIADLVVVTADPHEDIAHMRRIESVVRAGELRAVTGLGRAAEGP